MSAGDKLIIVVEDDEFVNETLCDLLMLNGFTVKNAYNGEKGLELIREEKEQIQMIISDIMMPVMNGIEMLEEVKKDPELRAIPFVFLTAKNDKETLKLSLKRGAYDYLEKPFRNEEVIGVISEVMEGSGQQPLATELDSRLRLIENTLSEINRINSHQIRHSNAKILNILELLQDKQIKTEDAFRIISRMGENIESDTISINSLLDKEIKELPESNVLILDKVVSRIWLIDDDATVNYVHKRILEKELGVEVVTFNDPSMALKSLKRGQNPPDLIFLDINMPEMSGFDVLERIAGGHPDLKVIMLSSSVAAEDISRAMTFDHVVSYYTKPLRRGVVEQLKSVNSNIRNTGKLAVSF
jgi:CheY-like chemotaxis protein